MGKGITAETPGPARYRTFSQYLRQRYGRQIRKIPVDAGFRCPNRDGTSSHDGCIFCDNRAFSPPSRHPGRTIREQISGAINHSRRTRNRGFIAYLQPNTNTYGSPDVIACRIAEAVSFPEIVAVAIGTRPDCVDETRLAAIRAAAAGRDVWIEMGIPSAHDATLIRLNRNHTFADFVRAMAVTRNAGMAVCAHLILGLPGETGDDERETAARIAALAPDAVKIHPLHAIRGTRLHRMYDTGGWSPLSRNEYIRRVADVLERLLPATIVQRLSATCPADLLIAPLWINDGHDIGPDVTAELAARNSFQGILCTLVQAAGKGM